jgi:pimeloyl-ACP methyl ester carboxylesterase
MPKITLNGTEIYYKEYGQGKEVFVTSSMFGAELEEPLLLLPADSRLFAVTLRGYGESTHVKEDLGSQWYPTWAADVYRFSRQLGLDKFIYCGISHGAGVGWYLALAHPEVMRAFVSIVGAPHDRAGGLSSEARKKQVEAWGAKETIRAGMQAFAESLFLAPTTDQARLARREELKLEVIERFMSLSREEFIISPGKPFPEAKTNEDLAAVLGQIKVPTLLLCGMYDNIIPAEMSLLAARAVPGAKAVFFQNESHMLAQESPEKVADEINVFIAQLDRAGRD